MNHSLLSIAIGFAPAKKEGRSNLAQKTQAGFSAASDHSGKIPFRPCFGKAGNE